MVLARSHRPIRSRHPVQAALAGAMCVALLAGCGDGKIGASRTEKAPNTTSYDYSWNSKNSWEDSKRHFEKYGANVTPKWLALCDMMDGKKLAKFDIDKEKDRANRSAMAPWVCQWEKAYYTIAFVRINGPVNDPKDTRFVIWRHTTLFGKPANYGFPEDFNAGLHAQCGVTFEKRGTTYRIAFDAMGSAKMTNDQACDIVTNFAQSI